MKILVVDNLSPFTQDIISCLTNVGINECTGKEFSRVTQSDIEESNLVILSGRRRNNNTTNVTNSRIIRYCYGNGKPLLGICYGAEIIALTLGGSIRRMPSRVQGRTNVSLNGSENPLFSKDKEKISVYESHGFCIARLPAGFTNLASSMYCEFEIIANPAKMIYGTQFHPEKSGQDGTEMLANFINISR